MASGRLTSGSEILAKHPHPCFDKISREGYSIYFRPDPPYEIIWNLDVIVRKDDLEVARADFTYNRRTPEAYCQNVEVIEEHRRKGIANSIYVFAEKVMNAVLTNFWEGDSHQSAAAIALWNQANRPFGPQNES